MGKLAQKGKRYEVIGFNDKDEEGEIFNIGDIVISLETDDIPWCVLESEYVEGLNVDDYPSYTTMDMMYYGYDNEDDLSPLED